MHKRNRKKITEFCIGILIILLLTIAVVILIRFINGGLQSSTTTSVETVKEEEFSRILLYVNQTRDEAYRNLEDVSDNIQNEILSTCDMDSLKHNLENNIPDESLNNILKNNIEDNYFSDIEDGNNDIFVCNRFGILSDYSYKTSSLRDKENYSWEEEADLHYNKKLFKDAVNKILSQDTSELIIIEPYMNNLVGHQYLKTISKQDLENIYKTEGIEGLKGYQVLVPIYITSNGDIFGDDDIRSSVLIENNKIILVQRFSIYDQLVERDSNVLNSNVQMIQEKNDTVIIGLQFLGILLVIFVVVIILYLCSVFNNYILGWDGLERRHILK